MFFIMSDPDILSALTRFKAGDKDIGGVYDPNGMKDVLRFTKQPQSNFWFLNDSRFVAAPSRPFSASRENDFMHNKTMIIDSKTVITGSYNFSENAEANDENLLVIEARDVAAAYMQPRTKQLSRRRATRWCGASGRGPARRTRAAQVG